MSEYHKIETLYERDEHFKIGPDLVLRNRVYDTLKTWRWTEKVDGTNIRVIWQGGKLSFGGKTDNASIPADLVKWLYENVTPEKLAACFLDGGDVVIYGEGYGAGIQRGGIYGPTKKLIVFDVFVIDPTSSATTTARINTNASRGGSNDTSDSMCTSHRPQPRG
jgi:hypothetical protein